MSIAATVEKKKQLITDSGSSIYDPPAVGASQELYYADEELLYVFAKGFIGESFAGLAIRTRSRIAKERACTLMGYTIPRSFKKTSPRFPSQNLDVMIQKQHNVQVWNQDVDHDRRYIIAKVNDNDIVTNVKLLHGKQLASYDTTGTLTVKYQAGLMELGAQVELFSQLDAWLNSDDSKVGEPTELYGASPLNNPEPAALYSISELAEKLQRLIGTELEELGRDQERNRGAGLHAKVCECLGYTQYADNGQNPDIPHQLLEIKLQTSPTIDLGTSDPSSTEELPAIRFGGKPVRRCDIRYAVFAGKLDGGRIRITNLVLVTGKDFFSRFRKFGGKVVNKKIQIHLPKNFFD